MEDRTVDVLMFYEHKGRELESLLVIKALIEKRGVSVELCSVHNPDRIKFNKHNKPRMVVVPWLYSNYEIGVLITPICGKMKKVLNLQWEQVFPGDDSVAKRTPSGDAKLATHICWGGRIKQRLDNGGIKNAIVTGAPQLDFLMPKFDNYYVSREELLLKYGIDSSKKVILLISHFNFYNLSDQELESRRRLVDEDVYEFRKTTRQSRDIVMEWLHRLLVEYPDYSIVYRPHPSERKDVILEQFEKDHNRFFIIGDYSVKQWIKVSDVVLNWWSTASVEAFFAGVNSIYLRPVELPKSIEYRIDNNACKVRTYEQLVDYIVNPDKLELYYKASSIEKVISEYYLHNGSYATENIANLIMDMLGTDKFDCDMSYSYNRGYYLEKLKNPLKRLLEKLYDSYSSLLPLLRRSNKVDKYLLHYKNQQFQITRDIASKEEIKEIEGKIERILNKFDYHLN